MENSKDETMSALVLRGFIVGVILILIFVVSSRCYKAVRREFSNPYTDLSIQPISFGVISFFLHAFD